MKLKWPEALGVKTDVSLKVHCSWLVGGSADYFAEPGSIENLVGLQSFALKNKLPITILGGGTNVLINDHGIRGLVISLSKLTGIEMLSDESVIRFWAWAGTPKSELLKFFLKRKNPSSRFLAGLPGQVGGGVVMNAGVSEKLTPREFQEITEEVEVLRPDGTFARIKASLLTWGYRHCEGWRPGIITRVLISCADVSNDLIIPEVKKLNQSRLQKQPLELPSCGSVFRNPLPQHAGRLIEDVGLKGHTIGGAQISEKHANFIVNKNNATAKDIKQLMDLCVQRVKEKHGIELKSEVVWLGDPL